MPFCGTCGREIPGSVSVCPGCGAPVEATAAASGAMGAPAPLGPVGGPGSPLPAELRRWNWGAFLLNWVWGLGNRVYIGLLALVPVVGWVMAFVLGSRGNEWAWQAKRWESVEAFRRTQRRWAVAGGLLFGGSVLLIAAAAVLIPLTAPDEPTLPEDRSLTGAAPGAGLTRVASDDGSLVLRVPEGWEPKDGLHDEAQLQVANEDDNLYAVVIAEKKTDLDLTLERFGEATRESMLGNLKDGRVTGGPAHVTINGNPAIRYELRGTNDDTRIVYVHTVVESPTLLVQLIAWTAPSDYDSHGEELLTLLNTFESK